MSYGEIYPKVRAAFEGERVFILCMSSTTPKWTKSRVQMEEHIIVEDNTIVIENVVEKDTGTYVCEGKLENGMLFNSSSEILVGGKFFL